MRESYWSTCAEIVRGLADKRFHFFESAIETLDKLGQPIKSRDMDAATAMKVKGYQLLTTSALVASKDYVDNEEMEKFRHGAVREHVRTRRNR